MPIYIRIFFWKLFDYTFGGSVHLTFVFEIFMWFESSEDIDHNDVNDSLQNIRKTLFLSFLFPRGVRAELP